MERASSAVTPKRRARTGSGVDAGRSVETARARGRSTNTKHEAALIDPDKPLSDMQRLFVKYWASGESPLSASVKAGYTDGGSFAYRMIYMPNILRAYQAEKEAFERDSGMSRKRVIEGMLESIEMAKTMAEPSTMVAGWREIGRMCGYYEPVQVKHTVTHEGKVLMERLDKLSDEELMELIQKQAQAIVAPAAALPSPGAEDDFDDVGHTLGGAP